MTDRTAPRLIVVCGPGGTGKTTVADALSRELNLTCLHKDSVKAAVYDQLGLLTARSYRLFQTLIEEQLARRIDLIVEATFHGADAPDLLRQWQTAYGYDLVCIVCRADPESRRRRIETRRRHPAHAAADAQQLRALDSTADYTALPGRHLHLDTTRPLDLCIRELVTSLS